MSGRDLDAVRARIQEKAEQMLQELLAPDTTPLPQPAPVTARLPGGRATLAIEELALKAVRRQHWMLGSDPRFHDLVAAAVRKWPGGQRYDEHLASVMTGLLEDGIATGEFTKRDAATAARALLECLRSLTHPLLLRQLSRHEAEARARAQVQFLARALA